MKKIALFLLLSLLTVRTFGQAPNTLKHSSTSYVDDYANMFTPAQAQELDRVIRTFKDTVQISIVTVNDLAGLEPAEYAVKLGNLWGVGSHSNNGLLMLICPSAHKFFAATGGGIQGDLTDLQCSRLYDEYAKSLYKQGDMYGGTLAVLNKYINVLSPSAKEFRTKQEAAEAAHRQANTDKMIANACYVFGFILAIILLALGIRNYNRKQAEKRAAFDELKHQFNTRVKQLNDILNSFNTDKEYPEWQLLMDMYFAANVGNIVDTNWKENDYMGFIKRVDDFKFNSKKLLKELGEKKVAKAEKEKQARIAEQRRSDAVEQAKSLLGDKTDLYYTKLNNKVSDVANSIPRLIFDKTNYTFKLDEYRNLITRIQKAVERVNVLYNSTVTVENVGELIKAMAEVKNLENNFKLAGESFNEILNAELVKVNKANGAKNEIERQITVCEKYIGKKGTTEKGNTRTSNLCNALRARLNEFNGLSIYDMYILYETLLPGLNACQDAKNENDAYEREEQRKRDEEARRQQAIIDEQRRVAKAEEDRKRRLREEEEEADRRRRSSYSSSYSSSSSSYDSSSSSSSSSSDSSSSFSGGSFDGGGGGGSW